MDQRMDQWLETVKKWREAISIFVRGLFSRKYSQRGLVLLFVVALLTGMALKSLVRDPLTIGFDDYTLSKQATLDMNVVEKNLIQSGGTLAAGAPAVPKGESCAEEE